MTIAEIHDASTQGEAPTWAWPVYALVAWLATILGYIARFKRARRFKPDWRDSWEDLRQSEWLRDQLIAQGVQQLLNNQPLHLGDSNIQFTPPATYGGPCPRTPFEMNRRFLALARWAADPEAIIRERFRRLKAGGCPLRRASRATSPSLRLEEKNHRALSSSGDSRGRWIAASSRRDGGGSRRLASTAQPRAPPALPHSLFVSHPESARFRGRPRMPTTPVSAHSGTTRDRRDPAARCDRSRRSRTAAIA